MNHTKQHYYQLLIPIISDLDNQLITETHEGNRAALVTKLAVARDLLQVVIESETTTSMYHTCPNCGHNFKD